MISPLQNDVRSGEGPGFDPQCYYFFFASGRTYRIILCSGEECSGRLVTTLEMQGRTTGGQSIMETMRRDERWRAWKVYLSWKSPQMGFASVTAESSNASGLECLDSIETFD